MRSPRARPDRRGAGRDGADGRESAAGEGLPSVARKLRCAVYTRKSTEEGLDMEFNSLDAQREACEAYIVSQRAEGWLLVEDGYDDGGVSGGTLERPALKRLLADVEAGKIDVVLVYKIDRLSRSMLDFLKLVETFERHGVTFVSITQAFNTTSSMGRLTLNMLLSFAQFEREVIGERIRDKVAASRKKGMCELFPAEQARIVELLVERVDLQPDGIDLRLRIEGLTSLYSELRTSGGSQQEAA